MRKNRLPRLLLVLLILMSCGTTKNVPGGSVPATAKKDSDESVKRAELLDDETFKLASISEDSTYGYQVSNPVKVGGVKNSEGPLNERRYLNALLGPEGETIQYNRRGSCCPFETPNGLISNSGMLDIYSVTITGTGKVVNLFINMYDFGSLSAPKGFTFKK